MKYYFIHKRFIYHKRMKKQNIILHTEYNYTEGTESISTRTICVATPTCVVGAWASSEPATLLGFFVFEDTPRFNSPKLIDELLPH